MCFAHNSYYTHTVIAVNRFLKLKYYLTNLINIGMAATFKGFSTINKVRAPYTVTDAELVKRDLLNEFNTRKGERVMRPEFGSIVWDMLMNPEDTFTEQEIREDIERIIAKDPRIKLDGITLYDSDHAIRAEISLTYLILNSSDILYVEFTRDL
jgi:phage baseplate assembly protein W